MFEPNTFQRDVAGHIKQQKLENVSKQQVRSFKCVLYPEPSANIAQQLLVPCLSTTVGCTSMLSAVEAGCHGYVVHDIPQLTKYFAVVALQHTYDRKRQEAAMRESMRWEQLQAAQQAEAERWQHVREAGLKGKQNKSSEHYNIISLNYHPTREGETLRIKVSHMHASMHSRERGPVCHVVASRNREKQAFNTH
jgi:hypothetical protein